MNFDEPHNSNLIMDRYRRVRKLGHGCYGNVLLVERLVDGALLAMKRVLIEDQPAQSTELNSEVAVLAKLQHPNIVHYYESFLSDKYLCIVMDYCAYGDLSQRIKAARSTETFFTEAQIWEWFTQLCSGLEHIHSHRVIHRDLKTQNIFVSDAQELKIGDFGISRVLLHSGDLARTSIGTPYYLAPEICQGRPYDNRADLWSLGCILYELCSLRRPYEADSLITLLNRISTCEYEPIPEWYSEELKTMVGALLNKVPGARPSLATILSGPVPVPIPSQISSPEDPLLILPNPQQTFNESCIDLPSTQGKSFSRCALQAVELDEIEEKPFSRRTYQKEILINIPTPTSLPAHAHPGSAPSYRSPDTPYDTANSVTTSNSTVCESKSDDFESEPTQRTRKHFTFSESLLKHCPSSPNRPFLMGDFLKKKLGVQRFDAVKRILKSIPDPAKLLREEPWVISDICGEENLSIIDVGIAFDAFGERAVPYPPTSTHKNSAIRVFPVLRRD